MALPSAVTVTGVEVQGVKVRVVTRQGRSVRLLSEKLPGMPGESRVT